MDRLTSLAVFGHVVETGGFSAAGRRLNMSVTTVSNHIQALEERLGARLLNRTTRKISLTEVGKEYYERSRQILLDLDEADRLADELNSTPRGTLKLFTGVHLVRFLSPVVAEFLAANPAVSVDLTTGERLIDLVEFGYDLAIIATLPPDSSLVARRLTPWRHILCCSKSYLDTHPMPTTPADLAGHNCLRYLYYPFGQDWRFEAPGGEVQSVRVSGNAVTTSGELLRTLTLNGLGLYLAPSFMVGEDVRDGRLIRLLPDYRPVEFAINAVYPHRHHLSSKVRLFVDLVAERFAEHRKLLSEHRSPEDEEETVLR
jgi:DNA-binding transcriptional LysR family regulator